MLLGTLALVEARRAICDAAVVRRRDDTLFTAFLFTILLLAAPYFYAVHKLRHFDPATLPGPVEDEIDWTNPCRADPELPVFSAELDNRLQLARAMALDAADTRIVTELDAFFSRAEQGVDAYLDWYFTVLGEYQRLAAAVAGDFGALMQEQLNRHLFEDAGFESWLAETCTALDADAEQRTAGLARDLGSQLRGAMDTSDCTVELLAGSSLAAALGDPLGLTRDVTGAGASAAGGATAAALGVKALSKQVAGAVASKVAAKKSFQTAVALGGKAAAKKSGSSIASALGATAVCAPSGLWAVGCGIGAGVITWLAADKVMIEVDEARFREEMHADLMAALDEQPQTLEALLHQRQTKVIDNRLQVLTEQLKRRYVPARD